MSKKKQKQNALQPQNNLAAWLKKYWWILAVCMLAIAIPSTIYVRFSTEANDLRKRFDKTHTQLELLFSSISNAPQANDELNNIVKKCKKQYFGFNYQIECGTYVNLFLSDTAVEESHGVIRSQLSESGFTEVSFTDAAKGASEGTISFMTENSISCAGYWNEETLKQDTKGVRYALFCRDYTPQFLDGYEVVD